MSQFPFTVTDAADLSSVLADAVVGIAGAGGLGSNAAMLLSRVGVGSLIVADFDQVEETNLNRQFYFRNQIGVPKVVALGDNLRAIDPGLRYVSHEERLEAGNVAPIFAQAEILIEALDSVSAKMMLFNAWTAAFPQRTIIMGSGIGGIGGNNSIRTEKAAEYVYICGDGQTDISIAPPLGPRVTIVASMQANLALELLLQTRGIIAR